MGQFCEFFAGAGMARAGLGSDWTCLFANDVAPKKASSYGENWGGIEFRLADIARLTASDLASTAALAWASFPGQDLLLAGSGAGLQGTRSATLWSFPDLMRALAVKRRPPAMIVLQSVCGTLTSHEGQDFQAIASAIPELGYRFAFVIDAVGFLPQSRPRRIVVVAHPALRIPPRLVLKAPTGPGITKPSSMAARELPAALGKN